MDESVQNNSNSKGNNKESKPHVESTAKPGNTKGQVKISLQENLFGDNDPPMNFYGSNPPENDKDSEDMETETEVSENKGDEAKGPPATS